MYIDKLDDIINKHNDTCINTIKMKPADIIQANIYTLKKKMIRKILNLKLVTM